MASTFTLNFCLSGILGYGWGSFNQPGLLNFGDFRVGWLISLDGLCNILNCDVLHFKGAVSQGFDCFRSILG